MLVGSNLIGIHWMVRTQSISLVFTGISLCYIIIFTWLLSNYIRRTNHHDSILNEHELVTNKVGLIDLTPFAKIKVSGSYARAFLDYAVAGTVPKAGRTSLAHALTDGGKVMAEWTITGDPSDKETFMIVTGSGVRWSSSFRKNMIFTYMLSPWKHLSGWVTWHTTLGKSQTGTRCLERGKNWKHNWRLGGAERRRTFVSTTHEQVLGR